jgi:glycolate oxidase FAD binding subunit
VLTEVAFKVLPVPESEATLSLPGLDVARSVAAMAAALGSPFEVTGAARGADGITHLRIEGFAGSVAYRAGALAKVLAPFGAVAVADKAASAAIWAGVRDVAAFHGRPGDVWRLSVKPSDAPALVAGREAVIDWGGGLVWLKVDEGRDLRAELGAFAGHATLVRASAATRARIAPFPPEAPGVAALTRALRAKFDPRGILNTGILD